MLEFEVPPPQQQFFEGAEKLLEVWFTNTDGPSDNGDLRKIPRLVGYPLHPRPPSTGSIRQRPTIETELSKWLLSCNQPLKPMERRSFYSFLLHYTLYVPRL